MIAGGHFLGFFTFLTMCLLIWLSPADRSQKVHFGPKSALKHVKLVAQRAKNVRNRFPTPQNPPGAIEGHPRVAKYPPTGFWAPKIGLVANICNNMANQPQYLHFLT